MKKVILCIIALMLSACVDELGSTTGLSGIYEGQSKDTVLKTLKKNDWIILAEESDSAKAKGITGIVAKGATKEYKDIIGKCREATFIFLKNKGLQLVGTKPCDKANLN